MTSYGVEPVCYDLHRPKAHKQGLALHRCVHGQRYTAHLEDASQGSRVRERSFVWAHLISS